jgi:uncharacterized membrane-anchored protein
VSRRTLTLVLAVLVQLVLVGLAVAPQLSARLRGETYLMRVELAEPSDAPRGSYVALDYPDLHNRQGRTEHTGPHQVFLVLRRDGAVWVSDRATRTRPSSGRYLECSDRDFQVRCGIESWFASEGEAADLEAAARDGRAFAKVRIDDRGHAALVAVEVR